MVTITTTFLSVQVEDTEEDTEVVTITTTTTTTTEEVTTTEADGKSSLSLSTLYIPHIPAITEIPAANQPPVLCLISSDETSNQ